MVPEIQFASVMLAGAAAAYTDWKTGFIYDWITYPLIALGIIASLVTQEWIGLMLGAAIYGVGLLVYRTGKMGGGDIKLLSGIAFMQPVYNGTLFPLTVLLVAVILASIFFGFWYVGTFLLTKPKIDWKNNQKRKALIYAGLSMIMLGYVGSTVTAYPPELLWGFALALVSGILYYFFEAEIKEKIFLQRVKLEELEEDEVVAVEHLSAEEKHKMGKHMSALAGPSDVLKFKHMGLHSLPVYRNLPKFAPFIFAGILITYLFTEAVGTLFPLGLGA